MMAVFRTPTSPEALAQRFHEAYERLAPAHGYETRQASAVPWADVPEPNRRLMIAVCTEFMGDYSARHAIPMAPMPAIESLRKCQSQLDDDGVAVGVSRQALDEVLDWIDGPLQPDYEAVLADHDRLVRELDVLLNGEAGAAKQASLCDIVGQVRAERLSLYRGPQPVRAEIAALQAVVDYRAPLGRDALVDALNFCRTTAKNALRAAGELKADRRQDD